MLNSSSKQLRPRMMNFSAKKIFINYSWLKTWVIAILTLFLTTTGLGNPPVKDKLNKPKQHWVGTWATAIQLVEPGNMPPSPDLANNTIRQIVCVSKGGKTLRFRFSNDFGESPVNFGAVQIAVSAGGSSIDETTTKHLLFNHEPNVTIAPGSEVLSDPLDFDLKPRTQLAITIYFGKTPASITGHPGSRTTSYLLTGNQTAPKSDFSNAVKTDHWYFIQGIDVISTGSAVAVLGDSITDGRGSTTNQQDRWPDLLAINLENHGRQIGVLNLGIGGNCVVSGGLGQPALKRFDRDVLKQPGVRWLIIFEGVNDIGGTKDSTAAAGIVSELTSAYDIMIAKAHAAGIKVYGCTITPFKKSFYYKDYRERARASVNSWIRTSGHFDKIIDFDEIVRDPADPETLLAELQSDYLHLNAKGYQKLGTAIDLALFK